MKQVIAFAFLSLIWYASACLAQEGISTLIGSDTESFAYKLNAFGGKTRRSFDGQPIAQAAGQTASDAETEKELTRIAQELVDAVARGDKAVWEKHVADDVIFTDENWTVLTKRDLVDSLAPLPAGYSGSIKVTKVRSRIHGDAAVLSWEGFEEQTVYGQKLTPVYLITDTYFKRNGRWQLVAEHVAVRPQSRKARQMNPARYNSFIGEYELTPGLLT